MSSDTATDVETTDDEPGVLTKAYRSVSPRYESHPDAEMDSVGWVIFLGMLVLLVPLLPFLLIVWVLGKVLEMVAERQRSD
ncbi:DUF7535 family protein [Salinigranum sp. GCM10025319]|uniref:DUF7535 family protein n=1 Tax=Salinigranum sp. GCM10025319 TaxID=3252687 RepID=UPI00360EC607